MAEEQINPKITTRLVNIEFEVPGCENCPGYLSPNGEGSKQGLVLVQEWWGVNQSIAECADTFAKQGFRVIIADVYRGKTADSREEAGHLIQGLNWTQATKDMQGAANYLKEKLGCTKVGIVGFCMGGALTFAALSAYPDVFSAGSPYYGICDLNSFPLKNIKVPILGHFGELDDLKGFADPETAKQVEKQGKDLGLDIEIKIWPGAKHAFNNIDRPEAYDKKTADATFNETVEFFKTHLK
ncbi:hypothetical protein PPERSA_05083 [Pseudocohnilembus persalinus]|uniref:Dienelactone hydrolase domain-containing protein n=1 Tax=Pseudocohnilembus persalinus TaxID=266149 RepID=A0A0V0QW92_PSEPJ|nr:hypothetical protein PPERSA_05083 [Pseudocohnilembus persalinus]|eukprot:KRX06470.1 hypothetical protein PPERSA_05083 [Pseudocohnilembus persalinus]